jgi:hypothetical protein
MERSIVIDTSHFSDAVLAIKEIENNITKKNPIISVDFVHLAILKRLSIKLFKISMQIAASNTTKTWLLYKYLPFLSRVL